MNIIDRMLKIENTTKLIELHYYASRKEGKNDMEKRLNEIIDNLYKMKNSEVDLYLTNIKEAIHYLFIGRKNKEIGSIEFNKAKIELFKARDIIEAYKYEGVSLEELKNKYISLDCEIVKEEVLRELSDKELELFKGASMNRKIDFEKALSDEDNKELEERKILLEAKIELIEDILEEREEELEEDFYLDLYFEELEEELNEDQKEGIKEDLKTSRNISEYLEEVIKKASSELSYKISLNSKNPLEEILEPYRDIKSLEVYIQKRAKIRKKSLINVINSNLKEGNKCYNKSCENTYINLLS